VFVSYACSACTCCLFGLSVLACWACKSGGHARALMTCACFSFVLLLAARPDSTPSASAHSVGRGQRHILHGNIQFLRCGRVDEPGSDDPIQLLSRGTSSSTLEVLLSTWKLDKGSNMYFKKMMASSGYLLENSLRTCLHCTPHAEQFFSSTPDSFRPFDQDQMRLSFSFTSSSRGARHWTSSPCDASATPVFCL
jgi:hypothetical protein